jgi:hypothetical protein
MVRIARFTSLAALVVFALTACNDAHSDREQVRTVAEQGSCPARRAASSQAGEELRPREVLSRLADALRCPGHVAHVMARVEHGTEAGPAAIEYWLDIENGALRIHSRSEGSYTPLQIVNDEGEFRRDSDDDRAEKSELSEFCSGYTETLLSYLIDIECVFFSSGPGLSVEAAEYDSRPAVVLRSQRLFPYGPDEEDGIVEFDARLYVDPDTFAPLGASIEGTLESHALRNEKVAATYELDFIPLGSLASDFFEPSSIGYVEPIAELDGLKGTLYWLGENLPASDGFSELRIDDVWSPERSVEPGEYIGIIYYEPDVTLHEYDVAKMDNDSMRYWQDVFLILDECLAETLEVDLGGAHGVIWGTSRKESEDGTCGPATHYEARVFFEETIVTIITSENTGAEFDSADGMERIMRGLKRRA